MTLAQRRGWCPSALKPMETGDGLLMRLRAPLGRLSLAQAQGLAEAAQRHGNGVIDLTRRGNLQLRGLTQASHPALLDAVAALGLLDLHPQNGELFELPCTVITSPFAEPSEILMLRVALEAALLAEPQLVGLPPKFCIVLDELPAPLFEEIPAHLRLYVATNGEMTLVSSGQTETITCADAPQRLVQLAREAVSHGANTPHDRWAVQHLGLTRAQKRALMVTGVLTHEAALAFGLISGSMQASALLSLVAALRRVDATELRLTPWHVLVAPQIPQSAVPGLIAAAQACGFLVEGDDPRLAISACSGKPACGQAHLPVRLDAKSLGSLIGAKLQQNKLHVHVSGCDKFCARPQRADYVLEATPDGYNLLDRASSHPVMRGTGLTLADAAKALG